MANENSITDDELKILTQKMAVQHAKISQGEKPEDETALEDQIDDMWYSFAIPDFENSPVYDGLDIHTVIKKLKLQDLYKGILTKELKKRYKL